MIVQLPSYPACEIINGRALGKPLATSEILRISKVAFNDYELQKRFYDDIASYPIPRDYYKNPATKTTVLFAKVNGTICGYIILEHDQPRPQRIDKPDSEYIARVVIDPAMQNKGVITSLMIAALKTVKDHEKKLLCHDCYTDKVGTNTFDDFDKEYSKQVVGFFDEVSAEKQKILKDDADVIERWKYTHPDYNVDSFNPTRYIQIAGSTEPSPPKKARHVY